MKTQKQGSVTVFVIIALVVIIGIAVFSMYSYSKNDVSVVPPDTNTPATTTNNTSNPATTTSQTGTVNQVKNFYIAIEDNGQMGKAIGCNDSVVPVTVDITPTQAPLRPSLEKLLANKNRDYGQSGFVNALYQSNLKIDSAVVSNGVAIVKLSGSMMLGGVCDSPRVQAQLEETVKQFPTVKTADIYINNQKLADYLSQK